MSEFNKQLLKALRIKKGYSLQKLADLCNISKTYLWELENKETNISAKNLYKISNILNIRMEDFLEKGTDFDFKNITKEFVKIELKKLLSGLDSRQYMKDIVRLNQQTNNCEE